MASYEIEITRTAEKQVRKLDTTDRQRILRRILALRDDPVPRGSRRLSGYDDVFRVRVGAYRIIYSLVESRLVILVLKVGHRRDVYRRR